MSIQLQLRRGNTTENQNFTGAEGEVTINTQTHELVVHDGSTKGGHQIPTMDQVQAEIANIPSIYYTPNVDTNGIISWTNNGGLNNPEQRNIKGPQGPQGPQGQRGQKGAAGDTGHTTNCITEIPQDIKLELENGEVTLKSGSKISVPDGNEYVPDVSTWELTTNSSLGNTEWLKLILYNNIAGQTWYKAIGNNGCTATSTNGSNIVDINFTTGLGHHDWVAFAVGNWYTSSSQTRRNRFLALSSDGYVSKSDDDSNWTTPVKNSQLANAYWRSVFWDGTQFIAFTGRGLISTSSDGTTWTKPVQNSDLSGENWHCFSYNGTNYIALSKTKSAISSDGINWTITNQVPITPQVPIETWADITYGPNGYVALTTFGKISTSSDGVTWTALISISDKYPLYSFAGCVSIVYNNGLYTILTDNGEIYTSSDLTNWAYSYNKDIYTYLRYNKMIWDGTRFVVIRENGTILFSSDGITWSINAHNALHSFSQVDTQAKIWKTFAYDGTNYIAICDGGAVAYVSTSTDGVNWTTPVQNTLLHTSSGVSDIIYDGEKFMVIPAGNRDNISYTTSDGVNWSNQYCDLESGSYCAVFANGLYIVLSSNGYIQTSIDGKNWTTSDQNSNLGERAWSSIVWDGSKFIALSLSGYISTSVNGSTWTTPTQNSDLGSNRWSNLCYNGTKLITFSRNGCLASTINNTAISGYTTITTTQDLTYSFGNSTGQYMLFNDGSYFTLQHCVSGNTDSLGNQPHHAWYDLSTNLIKVYDNDGSTLAKTVGFPVSIVTINSGSVTSIDQIFNGYGYIGSTAFLLSGVKGFIPNGRSIDGNLNNIEFLTLSDTILTQESNSNGVIYLTTDGSGIYCHSNIEYNILLNKNIIDDSMQNKTAFAKINVESGSITEFKPKQVFFISDNNNI